MTLSRKICLCMTLLMAPAYGQQASTAIYSSDSAAPSAGTSSGTVTGTNAPVAYSTGFSYTFGDNRLTEPVLVVPAQEVGSETVGRIIEDLSIMSRIIEKNSLDTFGATEGASLPLLGLLRPDRRNTGPEVLFSSTSRPRPLYVAGYGAVFFIQVGFPLLSPPDAKDKPPAEEPADAVWTQTRQSIFEPRPRGLLPGTDVATPEPYSREKVEMLRSTLIASMKHAANIRALEPREWLTIVVQGVAPQTDASASSAAPGGAGASVGGVPNGRSVLTLRATKADVDLYAKRQLSQAQFEQRLQVVIY